MRLSGEPKALALHGKLGGAESEQTSRIFPTVLVAVAPVTTLEAKAPRATEVRPGAADDPADHTGYVCREGLVAPRTTLDAAGLPEAIPAVVAVVGPTAPRPLVQ